MSCIVDGTVANFNVVWRNAWEAYGHEEPIIQAAGLDSASRLLAVETKLVGQVAAALLPSLLHDGSAVTVGDGTSVIDRQRSALTMDVTDE